MKMDAKFYGEIRKAKDGSIVPDDEYIVFLVKDNAFALVLPIYASVCAALSADVDQIQAVNAMVERAMRWRCAHPDRLKVPDALGEMLINCADTAPYSKTSGAEANEG